MDHFESISLEDLQQALDTVEGKKPTKRLLAAIAYKNGITQTELAEWYGVQRRTIYSWLKRLEEQPLTEAVHDAHRSGRPRKLSSQQQDGLKQILHQPPQEVGYDALTWSPELVSQYIDDIFGIDYSLPSCRRLMKEAGLRYRTVRQSATSDDPDELASSDTKHWLPP